MRVELPQESTGTQPLARNTAIDLPAFPCAKLKLDQFFLQWLSDHQDTVSSLLEDVKSGRPVRGPAASPAGPSASPLSPLSSSAHGLFAPGNPSATPPLSPSKQRSPHSPLSPQRRSSSTLASGLKRPQLSSLPQFYFTSKVQKSEAEQALQEFTQLIDRSYALFPNGMPQMDFVDNMHRVCKIPKMVGQTLFLRLSKAGRVSKDTFLQFWLPKQLVLSPLVDRVFQCLKQEGQEYLTHADFQPLMDCVLQYHPGLEFLKETAEFQKKYAETVIYRIFYNLNRCGNGRLALREIRRADLIEALELLDSEEDINKILKYFSYEHFYVIYCKFWELDQDHDFLIDRDDLAHYSQGALSLQVIDRIFEQVPRRFSSQQAGKMSYEDFVWFILSEEDKVSDTALEYWFRCVDLDCDGVIRPREMWFFYEEQLRRMENMPSGETVLFEDVVCQLHDMLHPEAEGAYTLRDLKRVKPQSGIFFNALFNLHKFLSFENRDPFAARAEAGEHAGLSEWDKFAKIEYYRLASEDDQEEVQMEADEAPWQDDSIPM